MHQQPRQVKFQTKIELLKHRPFQALLGLYLMGFTILFISVGVSLSLSFVDRTIPSVDYDQVNKNGKLITGQITNIEIQNNLTYNSEHPAVISYRYTGDNNQIESKYQILASEKVKLMNVGDQIEIKYLDDESILNGFEPFSFPVILFALIPIPIFIIGLVLLFPSITKFRRDVALYKYGKASDAILTIMTPKSGFAFTNFGQRILVQYKYQTSTGQNILGESLTTDFSIINEKKQGDTIKIFVSGQDESRSALIPKIEAIRNDWRIEGVDK